MKLIKVELFLKLEDTAKTDWIVPHIEQCLEYDESVVSFHTEVADPSDIGLETV